MYAGGDRSLLSQRIQDIMQSMLRQANSPA